MSRADAMGMRRRMPVYGAVAPEGEQIAAAAVKVGDRVFTGPSHAVAIKKAEATFDAPFETLPLAPIPDGFVTTGGRFVSRHEAADIAAATRQARPVGPTGLPAWQGLASERLRPGNPNAATSGVSTGATAPGLPGGEGAAWLSLEPGAGTTTLWHRAANPVRVDVQGATLPEIHATLAEAWSRGHDSVMLKNYMRPGATKPEDIIVVRERAQLRDPRARFDPAKRNSDDLSASIAALLGPSVAVQVGGRASPQTSEDAFWDAWRRGDAL